MANSDYDSRPDTYAHIATVREYMLRVIRYLMVRAHDHDLSKLEEPELSMFNEFTPKLATLDPHSEEYKQNLADMGEGLRHHYKVNDHHPEHHVNGIADMDLLQVTEMLCDWKAATERHENGDLRKSIEENASRFGYGWEMRDLLTNTARNLGWL